MKRLLVMILTAGVLLSGCGGPPLMADARFEAGRYRGEGEGYGGTITVEVETTGRRIAAVHIIDHNESPVISDPAFREIPVAVLASQGADVDTVSGCTATSRGLIAAIAEAIAKGSLDKSVLLPLPEEEAPAMAHTLTREADVVVIGGGAAGLSAAAEAIKAGASVIVIEKQPAVGGETLLKATGYDLPDSLAQQDVTMTPGERAAIRVLIALDPVDDRMKGWQSSLKEGFGDYMDDEEALYLYDSAALYKLQAYVRSGYRADPALLEALGGGLASGKAFLDELGVRWTGTPRLAAGSGWRRMLTPTVAWGSRAAAFVVPQYNYIRENGGEILCGMTAEELILTGDRVTGVRGGSGSTAFEITARRGVVIATGAGSTEPGNISDETGYASAGDGLAMAGAVGAARTADGQSLLVPGWPADITLEKAMLLNGEGLRFVREDAGLDALASAILTEGGDMWLLTDSYGIASRAATPLAEQGLLLRADTLAGLAGQMGIPADALAATADAFNLAAERGGDALGRAAFGGNIAAAPFYACPVDLVPTGTGDGLKINSRAAVTDAEGRAIAGLYAAGAVTGGLGGIKGSSAIVFGRIAGRNAASE